MTTGRLVLTILAISAAATCFALAIALRNRCHPETTRYAGSWFLAFVCALIGAHIATTSMRPGAVEVALAAVASLLAFFALTASRGALERRGTGQYRLWHVLVAAVLLSVQLGVHEGLRSGHFESLLAPLGPTRDDTVFAGPVTPLSHRGGPSG